MITFRKYFLQDLFGHFQFLKKYLVTFGKNLKPWWDWGTQQAWVYCEKFFSEKIYFPADLEFLRGVVGGVAVKKSPCTSTLLVKIRSLCGQNTGKIQLLFKEARKSDIFATKVRECNIIDNINA